MAQAIGLGVCAYSSRAGGLLTGKYQDESAAGRPKVNPMYQVR